MKYLLCLILTLCMVSVSAAAPDQCVKGACKVPDQVKKVVKVKTADLVKVKKVKKVKKERKHRLVNRCSR